MVGKLHYFGPEGRQNTTEAAGVCGRGVHLTVAKKQTQQNVSLPYFLPFYYIWNPRLPDSATHVQEGLPT
jgi:hypothetical protein